MGFLPVLQDWPRQGWTDAEAGRSPVIGVFIVTDIGIRLLLTASIVVPGLRFFFTWTVGEAV